MKVRVIYFGMLAERVGIREELLDPSELNTSHSLVEFFNVRHSALQNCEYTVAVDQEIRTHFPDDMNVGEIALFPPFAGG